MLKPVNFTFCDTRKKKEGNNEKRKEKKKTDSFSLIDRYFNKIKQCFIATIYDIKYQDLAFINHNKIVSLKTLTTSESTPLALDG